MGTQIYLTKTTNHGVMNFKLTKKKLKKILSYDNGHYSEYIREQIVDCFLLYDSVCQVRALGRLFTEITLFCAVSFYIWTDKAVNLPLIS